MSIFRRLTGKHGEKAASGAEQLQASGGAKEHSRSAAELAKQGQVGPLFEKIVDGGAALLLEPHEAKQTLIHIAAENGQKAVVKFLLLHPAVLVDQADAHGNTPLLLACLHRRLEVVDLLLRRHASVKHVNIDGSTALHFLVRHQFNDQIQAILDALLPLGADKDAKDKQGETPLHKASASLNYDVVSWLLSHDADVNATNQAGETPLHKATRMLHADEEKALKLIDLLLTKGANPDASGEHGTAVAVASKKTAVPQLQELIQKAKDRRAEKQQKMLGLNAAGSRRLVDLPPDWASRDSKQRSVFLMQKWGTLKKMKEGSEEAAGSGAAKMIPPEIAVSEPPPDAPEEEMDLNTDRETQNLSSTHLIAEMERKESKAEGPPPSPTSASAAGVCSHSDGYRVEDGVMRDKPISPRHMVLDLPPEPYKKTYVQQKHWNFVGYLNVVGEEKKEPAAISILMRVNEELGFTSCAALIRTQLGVVELPMRPPSSTQPMDLLNALMADKTRFTGNPQFTFVDNPELIFEFLEYEKNDPQRCNCLPIGVIYVPRAGMNHLEVWGASNQTSDAFEQFLNVLGERITLQGWSAYAGGLDTVYDKKGKFSVYTKWRGLEIMFHVSTLLPYNVSDHAKVQIARVIGNDITNIVFLEGDGKYNPTTFNSAVTHVYGVVHPESNGNYRTAIASKSFVPKFGPDLPQEISRENFKDYFLTKIVNGHFASQRSKGLNMMYSRPREVLLRALVEQFQEPTPSPMKEERRPSSDKKDKKEKEKAEKEKEKAEKEKEKAEKDRLMTSSKMAKRKSVEIQQQPLKQLLTDAQKEKEKEKRESTRRNSPAPNRDRRMSHSSEHPPAELLAPEQGKLTPTRSAQADSPLRSLEASRSDSNVATTAKR